MAGRIHQRISSQRAFTLIEVLVVILIVGILAAIAIPVFLGQRNSANDANAKSNARSLVSQVETCFVPEDDYRRCDTAAEIEPDAGLPYGTTPGSVSVVEADKSTYVVESVSRSSDGGVNRVFRVERGIGQGTVRACSPDGGGCKNGVW